MNLALSNKDLGNNRKFLQATGKICAPLTCEVRVPASGHYSLVLGFIISSSHTLEDRKKYLASVSGLWLMYRNHYQLQYPYRINCRSEDGLSTTTTNNSGSSATRPRGASSGALGAAHNGKEGDRFARRAGLEAAGGG